MTGNWTPNFVRAPSPIKAMRTYKVDAAKQATFIKKALVLVVAEKSIVQVKGTGNAGRFKLAVKARVRKRWSRRPQPKSRPPRRPQAKKSSSRSLPPP